MRPGCAVWKRPRRSCQQHCLGSTPRWVRLACAHSLLSHLTFLQHLTCHPTLTTPGTYYVNLDRGILQLMHETKHMRRLGLAVPDSAHTVLLQVERLHLWPACLLVRLPQVLAPALGLLPPSDKAPAHESPVLISCQEEKLKHYHSQLSHALRELERVLGGIKSDLAPLLAPHVEDLHAKVGWQWQ